MATSTCNCKLEHVCAAPTISHTTHMVHHHHHHYVEREEGREVVSPRAGKALVNRLTPPIGTSFFHKETINIFENEVLGASLSPLETVTWRTEVYKYVTRARPDDPDFKKSGGEIYIIMIHRGTSQTGRFFVTPGHVKTVKVPHSMTPMNQFPASNSGIQTSNNWSYNIDYTNVMPMFNNAGNGAFDFEASYKEDFVLSKIQQTGKEIANGVEFATIEPQSANLNVPIIGLSVFKCLDPTVFPVRITFEASLNGITEAVSNSATKVVTIPFDFSL